MAHYKKFLKSVITHYKKHWKNYMTNLHIQILTLCHSNPYCLITFNKIHKVEKHNINTYNSKKHSK